jgi:Txe/YoeB family toxin of Txe-Axe toxin-antitoxin module
MRKVNVFGKKISHIKVVYFIAFIFAVVFGARLFILNAQEKRLAYYEQQEQQIVSRINSIINSNQTETYHLIGQIIQFLPNTYTSAQIRDEVEFVMNLSQLSTATNVNFTLTEQTSTPFGNQIPNTVRALKVQLNFSISSAEHIIDFVTNLYEADRIYYIEAMTVTINQLGAAQVGFTFYTFYNNVSVS